MKHIVKKMCSGCARVSNKTCTIIKEPKYFFEKHGKCFAKVSPERAWEIEEEIKNFSN